MTAENAETQQPWLERAKARYGSDDLVSVVLTRGQVGAVLGLVNAEAARLEAKGHVTSDPAEGEAESGVLKHLLGIEVVIQDAVEAADFGREERSDG